MASEQYDFARLIFDIGYSPVREVALSKRATVPLGLNIATLRSDGWVITIRANSDSPICYILRPDEVNAHAGQGKKGGAWCRKRLRPGPDP
ncbi:hypothetical protein [Pseudogemmobacter humi]|uniref:Uncharacterized protein n=1 Tax=Pseudogemmobacter humi TaxID=2483812 RepID=A0A3P5X1S9_9RHOB|nr:hypothetical protein [Pseudogemmobacter humi]VDC24566.1 hypothetical protein XINFAN_01241 [Pseudogemmobacter humi]